ncbi:MAG: DUF6279 family lipoprotein [Panacagrimonas sp.]
MNQTGRAAWRASQFVIVFVLALPLAACSAPQLVYDRLDWLASWQLGKYVELDPAQQQRFDSDLASLHAWHRAGELPRYSRDLVELSLSAQKPLSADQIANWSDRFNAHWNRLVTHAAPAVCETLASFSDAQVASVLDRVDRNIVEAAEDLADQSDAEIRKDNEKRLVKTLRRWVDDLDAAQRSRVTAWNTQRKLTHLAWLDQRRQWRDRLATALAARRSAPFCAQVKTLFTRSDAAASSELQTRYDSTRALWTEFLSGFSATLDTRQTEHLRSELRELSEDLNALAVRRSG